MNRRTLIVNPNASRVTEKRIDEVVARFRPVEVLRTEYPGHAIELAQETESGQVWVLGGDGLVNEALNGLRPDAVLGVIPAGGSNVLARAVGSGIHRISTGRVNGRRFAFAAGIGVDSEVVRELETDQRPRTGRRSSDLAYARAVVRRLLGGSEPRLEVVGLGRAASAFVSNGPVFTYAGPVPLRFAPAARFELGIDVVAPERISPAVLARLVPRLVFGRGLAGASGVLSGHDLDRIEIRCDVPLPLEADGEDLGDVTEAVFEAERDALALFV